MDYNSLKVVELKAIAKERGLKGYSTLLKSGLIDFLKNDDKKKVPGSPKIVFAVKKKTPVLPEPPVAKAKKAKSPKAKGIVKSRKVLSPIIENTEYKNIFKITPSLAFIYQISNPENKKYSLPVGFTVPNFVFTFEDAIECSENLDSPKWNIVNRYLEHFIKDVEKMEKTLNLKNKVDKEFLLELLKKEVLELQKGNLTLLHSKNLSYLVLDIISQLISGSYEGFKPKCLRKDDEMEKTALEIIKKLFNLPEVKKTDRKDHQVPVRKRVISSNITIFNNVFNLGESTLELFFKGSILGPDTLISHLNLSKKLNNFVVKLMNNIRKIGNYLVVMYSIPIQHLSKYIYPAKPFGLLDSKQKDIYKNLKQYLTNLPWKSNFTYQYSKQFRIVDLCYTKYGYKQGVRSYQLTDIPVDKLKDFVEQIDKNLSKEKEVNDWFVQYIDVAEKKLPKPLKSIRTIKTGKLLEPSVSELTTIISDLEDEIWEVKLPKPISPKRAFINLEEPELIVRASPKVIVGKKAIKIARPEKDIVIVPVHEIDYNSKTVLELKAIAKSKGLKKYSALRKADLIELLTK